MSAIDLKSINLLSVAVRLVLTCICGGLMGLERSKKMRVAGFRTFMLISMGSCLTVIAGLYINSVNPKADPARIPAQVISGISFIGAGTIMLTGSSKVKGLTTAACLWVNACIGILFGAGFYGAGLISTAMVLLCMIVGAEIQNNFLRNGHRIRIFTVIETEDGFKQLMLFSREHEMTIVEFESTKIIGACTSFSIIFDLPKHMTHDQAVQLLRDSGFTFYTVEN